MTFELVHKGDTEANAVYHFTNARGDIVGSANIAHGQESDFLTHWRGANTPGTPAGSRGRSGPGAKLRLPPMSRAAVLRGC